MNWTRDNYFMTLKFEWTLMGTWLQWQAYHSDSYLDRFRGHCPWKGERKCMMDIVTEWQAV